MSVRDRVGDGERLADEALDPLPLRVAVPTCEDDAPLAADALIELAAGGCDTLLDCDAEALPVPDTEHESVGDSEALGVDVCVPEAAPEGVPLDDGDARWLEVCVLPKLTTCVGEAEGVDAWLAVAVCDADRLPVPLDEGAPEGVTVELRDDTCDEDALPVPLGVAYWEGVRVPEGD